MAQNLTKIHRAKNVKRFTFFVQSWPRAEAAPGEKKAPFLADFNRFFDRSTFDRF